jgi:signal peptidase I
MSEQELKPRHPVGLAAIAFLLGPTALMLWLGRFRLALAYLALSLLLSVAAFILLINGYVSPADFNLARLDVLGFVIGLPISLLVLCHGILLNKRPPQRPWYSKWYVALPSHVFLSFAAALLVRTFFFQPFSAPSASNFPNLMAGDMFLVSKTAYLNADPQRGDIAVFKLPSDPGVDYVKRVIGLPRDRIQIKQGRLYLNGVIVPRETVVYHPPANPPDESASKFYRETFPNGRSYVIAERSDDGDADNTDEYVVPEGHYFALGDNRDNSQDSRFLDKVGYIPRANFTGPFVMRFWNTNGVALTGRPEETLAKN